MSHLNASPESIPLIDIFAGPGGLGEGFSSLRNKNNRVFHHALSIEKDPHAHRTLQLRAFYRQFPDGEAPEAYYKYLKNDCTIDQLYAAYSDQHSAANREAWCHTLSPDTNIKVRNRIRENLPCHEEPWVLLGGPPCQPFSLAGRSRNAPGTNTRYSDGKDTRHNLYLEYLQIIADFWPAVFVMENVRGLLSAKFAGQPMFPRIQQDLRNPGKIVGNRRCRNSLHTYTLYSVNPIDGDDERGLFPNQLRPEDYLVRCEDYGIPQARHRLILLGVRDDIEVRPQALVPQRAIPARRVLQGLPALRGGLSKNDSLKARNETLLESFDSLWLRQLNTNNPSVRQAVEDALTKLKTPKFDRGGDYLSTRVVPSYRPDWFGDDRLKGVCNHRTRGHMPTDLHRYLFASAFAQTLGRSPKLEDFPPALLPAHKNAANPSKSTKFADRFRVQLYDRPSTTVVSHIAKDGHYYIHPDPTQCRSFTVREAARLQTFPDNYKFVGNRTQQYHQVGNAVPPLLANQIAAIVYDLLKRSGLA